MMRIVCRQAISAVEQADHFAIRRKIFVEEQSIFLDSDRDSHDDEESVVRLLGYCDDVVAGTVRLFELDHGERLWQGDRLAVLSAYRLLGVGAPLVRFAVAAAAVRGGRLMTAHIQPANASFFERLGWTRAGDAEIYAGLVHQPMQIVLPTVEQGAATLDQLTGGVSARAR
jgi:putative N-acetyltransferase (TIGR04045 family)